MPGIDYEYRVGIVNEIVVARIGSYVCLRTSPDRIRYEFRTGATA